jgi:hypothetical protein
MRGKSTGSARNDDASIDVDLSVCEDGTVSASLKVVVKSTSAPVMRLRKFKQSAVGYRAAKMRAEGEDSVLACPAQGEAEPCPVEVSVKLSLGAGPGGVKVSAELQVELERGDFERTNQDFEAYYVRMGIVPPEEWSELMECLQVLQGCVCMLESCSCRDDQL